MGKIPFVNETELVEMLDSEEKPILLDMCAEWCRPCKMMDPALERFHEEYGDRIRFVKVDVDEYPEVARRFNITGLPCFLMLEDGDVAGSVLGALEDKLLALINDHS